MDYVFGGSLSLVEKPEAADAILVGGGDGFMLETIRKYYDFEKPFLGINCGTRGFLLNPLNGHTIHALEAHRYESIKIQKVAATVTFTDGRTEDGFFFNDLVLGGNILDYFSFDIVTQEASWNVKGTGLICNTPLGSTGYALNIGQPLLPLSSHMRGISWIAAAPFRYTFLHQQEITITASWKSVLLIWLDGYNDRRSNVVSVSIRPTDETVTLLFFDDVLFEEKRLVLALEKAGKGIV